MQISLNRIIRFLEWLARHVALFSFRDGEFSFKRKHVSISNIKAAGREKAAFRIAANSPRQEAPALVRGKVASFREKVLSKNEGRVHKLHRFELTNIFYILTFPNIDGELHKGPVGTSKFFAETPF